MEAKELVDAGVCVSMAEGRRLSIQMKKSDKCRQKVLRRINGPVVKMADAPVSKAGSLEE